MPDLKKIQNPTPVTMTTNSTNSQDHRLSAQFIKECRKFITALNSNCSMEELTELRQRIIQIRSKQNMENSDNSMMP
jgi:hypothetical protein